VVQVLVLVAREHELRRGCHDRRADVDPLRRRVVARHHPHADVPALLVRDVAPGLVAGLAGLRDRAMTPELLAGLRVERGDDARLRSALGLAAAARDHLAVCDDRPRAVLRAVLVVEDVRLPDELAGLRVHRVRPTVGAVVEDQVVVDREVAVRAGGREILADVFGHGAAVFPDELAGHGVERLCDVVRVREVENPVVDERRALLVAGRERARPDEAELLDVARRDLLERAVAPVVQRAPPHEPVVGIRVREHRVRDRRDLVDLAVGVSDRRKSEQRGTEREIQSTDSGGAPLSLDDMPDWTGFWQRVGPPLFDPAQKPGELTTAKLKPEALADLEHRRELSKQGIEYDPLSDCSAPGFPRWLAIPFLREFIVTPGQTYLFSETMNNMRRVYTGGRDQP